MIKVNNYLIDITIQAEEHTSVKKVLDSLSLDINNVLIVCPLLFLQRFIQEMYHESNENWAYSIEKRLEDNNSFTDFIMYYKSKPFHFYFIILSSETKSVNNPFKGNEFYKIGFKTIKTD